LLAPDASLDVAARLFRHGLIVPVERCRELVQSRVRSKIAGVDFRYSRALKDV
jgi:hypothetical protein